MAPRKTTGESSAKAVSVEPQADSGFVQKKGSAKRKQKHFDSDLAVTIIDELYPLLLENCTDEDDEVDTQAVFESLAGLLGLFVADYHEGYGPKKAQAAFQDLIDLAMNLYEERVANAAE